MYPTVVAVDLETTGADPDQDHIMEIGALLLENGKPGAEFSELVNPGVTLSPHISRLTGITQDMLDGAPPLSEVLPRFLAWMPAGALCIAHNAAFDRQFLKSAAAELLGLGELPFMMLDTVELSRICYPQLASHSLGVLSEVFHFNNDRPAHRALADCYSLAQLWNVLLAKADEIPLAALGELNRLVEHQTRHPYKDFFQRLTQQRLSRGMGEEDVYARLFATRKLAAPRPPIEPNHEYVALDTDKVRHWFGPDGAFAAAMGTYEDRPGQAEMAVHTAQALNSEQHLLVEAGTGIGKSIAYLTPALAYGRANNVPVIVSTNTKNLQSQLFEKDLPTICKALGEDFRAALLKGRRNYLCIRKLLYLLDQMDVELDTDDRMRLLNIIPWAVWTKTGDIAENIVGGRPHFQPLWGRLSSAGDDCLGRACRCWKQCFVWKARTAAQEADVVVVNHSLVFSDLGATKPTLPDYRHIIFDEAHNIEDAATGYLQQELSPSRVMQPLARLHRPGRSRRAQSTGLAASIEKSLASAPEPLAQAAGQLLTDLRAGAARAQAALTPFFHALEDALEHQSQNDTLRLRPEHMQTPDWERVQAARVRLFEETEQTAAAARALADLLRLNPDTLPYQAEYVRELDSVAASIDETRMAAEFVLCPQDEQGYVGWLERTGAKPGSVRVVAAPVTVGQQLHEKLYEVKKTVVFCSATMTVNGNFGFLAHRLGIDRIARERLLQYNAGTPYDYKRQCLAVVPKFLPEPGQNEGNYPEKLAGFLVRLFRSTEGRGMVLFTSNEMLGRVADRMEREIADDGITLLVQGRHGSRENITSVFRRGSRCVLLGTHSFWEGVDIPGDALVCLVIARLPFAVQSVPIIEARIEQVEAEQGRAFANYSLPGAVIRFRQGFGRLIRSHTDRGVAIIADRRSVTKTYGSTFLKSLPVPVETYSNEDRLLDNIEAFLYGSRHA